jgi:ribosomal protein L23
MSILNLKKKETGLAKTSKTAKKLSVVPGKSKKIPAVTNFDASGIIIRPRITEKVALLSDNGKQKVFMFEVSAKANKRNVSLAVQSLYKVVPVKVAVLRVPPKKSFVRGRVAYGVTTRKAYVYLKEGDKIEVV